MNREQMVEKVWIMSHDFAVQFGDELAGLDGDDNEEANEDAADILDPFAKGLVDALLPQVSTLTELEALQVGAVLLAQDGRVATWIPGDWFPAYLIGETGPLTVVWSPS